MTIHNFKCNLYEHNKYLRSSECISKNINDMYIYNKYIEGNLLYIYYRKNIMNGIVYHYHKRIIINFKKIDTDKYVFIFKGRKYHINLNDIHSTYMCYKSEPLYPNDLNDRIDYLKNISNMFNNFIDLIK